jgi:hypothetical protein
MGKPPFTSLMVHRVGPRAGLDVVVERDLLLLPRIKRRFLGLSGRSLMSAPTKLSRRIQWRGAWGSFMNVLPRRRLEEECISEEEGMMFYLKVLGRNSGTGIDTHKTMS